MTQLLWPVFAIALAATSPQSAGTVAVPTAGNDSLLVSTEWLAARLQDENVVVLHVVHDRADFTRGHIPRARPLSYMAITPSRNGLDTELPPAEALRDILEGLGVSDDSYVVLYGDPIGMAARAFFTLEHIGLRKVALLDGGLSKWRAERRRISTQEFRVNRGRITPRPQEVAVDADWVHARAGKPGVSLLDTRTDEEYNGTGGRRGMPSTGHIVGARQLQWQDLFRDSRSGTFADRDHLARTYERLVTPGDLVVTYCYVGYRASLTYFAARLLGYETRMYDGSYQDWAARRLPLVKP